MLYILDIDMVFTSSCSRLIRILCTILIPMATVTVKHLTGKVDTLQNVDTYSGDV